MNHAAVAIADQHEVGQRIEGVVELAPRLQHVFEQQHVLNRRRKLAAHFVGALQQLDLAARIEPHAVHH